MSLSLGKRPRQPIDSDAYLAGRSTTPIALAPGSHIDAHRDRPARPSGYGRLRTGCRKNRDKSSELRVPASDDRPATMTILQLAKSMRPGTAGVSTHIIALSEELCKRRHTVLVASAGGSYVETLEKKALPHYNIPFDRASNPKYALSCVTRLLGLVRHHKVDMIHCHWRITALFARMLFPLVRVPFVWTNHLQDIPSGFLHRLMTFHGKCAIVVSSDLRESLVSDLKIRREDVMVVYNGVDPGRYEPLTVDEARDVRDRLGIRGFRKTICLLSRLAPVKGHKDLLRAFAGLRDRSELALVMTGTGNEQYRQELLRLAQELGVAESVRLPGYCDPREVLGISDVFVLPSYVEGFPIACIEAMIMRVPVIRTKTGGWGDMGDCCIGIDVGDVAGLGLAIEKIIGDAEGVMDMVGAAYEFVRRECTVETMCDKIERIYESRGNASPTNLIGS